MDYLKYFSVFCLILIPHYVTGKPSCVIRKADLVFVLDESASIPEADFNRQKQFTNNIIKYFDIGEGKTHVGVVTFGSVADLRWKLGKYSDVATLQKAVIRIQQKFGTSTETGAALWVARKLVFPKRQGGRPNEVPQIGIVITDGNSQNWIKTYRQAMYLKDKGVTLFAIGVGKQIGDYELHNIATNASYVFYAKNYKQLLNDSSILQKVAERFDDCEASSLIYDEGCGGKQADVAWVTDCGNANQEGLQTTADFMREVSSEFSIGPDKVLVASLSTTCNTLPDFGLFEHTTKNSLMSALEMNATINNMPNLLSRLSDKTFPIANQAERKAMKKIALIVTDTKKYDYSVVAAAYKAKGMGIEMFVVGIGNEVNKMTCEAIASSPIATHIFYASDYSELRQQKTKLLSELCKDITQTRKKRRVSISK